MVHKLLLNKLQGLIFYGINPLMTYVIMAAAWNQCPSGNHVVKQVGMDKMEPVIYRVSLDMSDLTTHCSQKKGQYIGDSITKRIILQTIFVFLFEFHWSSLQWRHTSRDGVSDHQPHDCLLNGLFRRRLKKTSKHCVTGLYQGNSPVTGEFPAQRASNAENASIWWRHHGKWLTISRL